MATTATIPFELPPSSAASGPVSGTTPEAGMDTGTGSTTSAAPTRIGLPDLTREVESAFRESAAVSARSAREAVRTQSSEHAGRILDFLKSADVTLGRATAFVSEELPHIRTVAVLTETLPRLRTGLSSVRATAEDMLSEIVPMMQGKGAQRLSLMMQEISKQADAASTTLRTESSQWREEVFARQLHDGRLAKIDSILNRRLDSVASFAKDAGLSQHAQQFLRSEFERRASACIGDVRKDPLSGMIDSAKLDGFRAELANFKGKLVVPGAEGQKDRIELSESLKKQIDYCYGALARDLAARNQEIHTGAGLGNSGVHVNFAVGDTGKGKIEFWNTSTASRVTYSIGEKVSSAYERTQVIERLMERIKSFDPDLSESKSVRPWDFSTAREIVKGIQHIADSSPNLETKELLVPDRDARFEIEPRDISADERIIEVIAGVSTLSLKFPTETGKMDRNLKIEIRDSQFSATLQDPGSLSFDGVPTLKIIAPVSELRRGRTDPVSELRSGRNELHDVVRRLVDGIQQVGEKGTLTAGGAKVAAALLNVPHCRVTEFRRVNLEPEADVALKLAPTAEVVSVHLNRGAKLRISGTAERAGSIDMSGITSERKSMLTFDVTGATLADTSLKGQLAGVLRESTLSNVEMLGPIVVPYFSTAGVKTGEITDDKCVFNGCGWRIGALASIREIGPTKILARKRT